MTLKHREKSESNRQILQRLVGLNFCTVARFIFEDILPVQVLHDGKCYFEPWPIVSQELAPVDLLGKEAAYDHIHVRVLQPQAPYNADDIGVLDVQSEHFQTIDISRVTVGDMKFLGGSNQSTDTHSLTFNRDLAAHVRAKVYGCLRAEWCDLLCALQRQCRGRSVSGEPALRTRENPKPRCGELQVLGCDPGSAGLASAHQRQFQGVFQ